MTYVRILLVGLVVGLGITSYAENYIPEASTSIKSAEVILDYSFEPGANRPWARFKFKDGFEITLNAVGAGDYSWEMRTYEGERIIDLGSLKMEFDDDHNSIVITTRIDNNKKYRRYLDLLPGKYKKVE